MIKIKRQRISFVILVIFLGLLLMGTIMVIASNERIMNIHTKKAEEAQLEQKIVCEKIRKIDGQCIIGEDVGVYAVMIDNHVGARPPAGLSQASLVYETIVESPITRFLAVFPLDKEIEKIGPVRSARLFYVDWAMEFDGPYAHVGGSNAAIEDLNDNYDFNLDEFYNSGNFYRDNYRAAPHNVFTSSKLIKKAIEDKSWEVKSDFESWKFRPEPEVDGAIKGIEIDFKTNDFFVRWEYDVTQKNYVRYQGNKIHVESGGVEMRASNIIIMYTESLVIDDYGRLNTRTIGSGQALVFQNGQVVEGVWQRPSLNVRTNFFDKNGIEITFNVGSTWIEVVALGMAHIKY